ncbi:MAG: prepilin peptidase [Alphaproteobacteria bacterium]|nr:prepilin peptidase [Alphaproteobacteria bacterium]
MPIIDELWFRLLAGFLVGLSLGSFTTMLSYRAPRNISIVLPPSHCPKCRTPLKPRDLVPLLSWLMERGRCRHCQKPISARYLLIELATTAAVTAAFVIIGFKPTLIAALIGIVSFIALVTINIERWRQ